MTSGRRYTSVYIQGVIILVPPLSPSLSKLVLQLIVFQCFTVCRPIGQDKMNGWYLWTTNHNKFFCTTEAFIFYTLFKMKLQRKFCSEEFFKLYNKSSIIGPCSKVLSYLNYYTKVIKKKIKKTKHYQFWIELLAIIFPKKFIHFNLFCS